MSNFGRGLFYKYSCKTISESIYRLSSRICLKVFLFLALVVILLIGIERLRSFHRGSPKEHSCETMSKSVHRFKKRSCLKVFFLLFLYWPSCSVEQNRFSNFGEYHLRKHPVKLLENPSIRLFSRRSRLKPVSYL